MMSDTTQETKGKEIYQKFKLLFPDILYKRQGCLHLEAVKAKPLTVEQVFGDTVAMSHFTKKGKTPIPCPSIEIFVDYENGVMYPYRLENVTPYAMREVKEPWSGVDGVATHNDGTKQEVRNLLGKLEEFCLAWLAEIEKANYKIVRTGN